MKQSSIFSKIFIRVLICFILLSFVLIFRFAISTKELLQSDLISFGKLINHNIATSVAYKMATLDLSEFQTLINNLTDGYEVNYIYITDENYNIIIDTFSPKPPDEIKEFLNQKNTNRTAEFNQLNSIQIKEPILFGSLGYVFIGMNQAIINEKLIDLLPRIFFGIPVLLGLCLFLIYKVIKQVTKPLEKLTRFTKDIEQYDFDITKTNYKDIQQLTTINDEIGTFSKSYLTLYQELDNHIRKLISTTSKHSAIEKELTIASNIQNGLLVASPSTNFPNTLSFSTYFKAAKNIGGDFYDVIEKESTVYFIIGDVSGKGVPAALIASTILSNIRLACQFFDDPTDIITSVNQEFCKHNSNTVFITIFFGILNIENGEFKYINAGHSSPYILSNTAIELKSTKDPVIGVNEYHFYSPNTVILTEKTNLIFTTDGLEEAHNKNKELFGESRVKELLNSLKNPSATDCKDILVNEVTQFSKGQDPHDDITILSVCYTPQPKTIPNPLIISFNNDIDELKKLHQVTTIFSKIHNISEDVKNSLNLVLEELLSNTIFYGYKDNKSHLIYVKFEHLKNKVTITIEDDGIPFNPLEDAPDVNNYDDIMDQPVGGLGIQIVKNMVDNIEYIRSDNKNTIVILKDL